MGQRAGYKQYYIKALNIIKKIRPLTKEFSHFELSQPVREEIESVLRLCRKHWHIKKPYKNCCLTLVEDISLINEHMREITLLTSGLLQEAQRLPIEYRQEFYEQLGIEEIPQEFQGLGEDLQALVETMLWSTEEFLEDFDTRFSVEK